MKNRKGIVSETVLAGLVVLSIFLGSCASQPAKKDVEPPAVPSGGPPPATAPMQPRVQEPPVSPAPGQPPAPAKGAAPATAPLPPPIVHPAPPLPEETKYYVHTVKFSGETVSIIAGWYLGDIMKYEALAAANPTINPSRIVVGNKIRIPEHLMIKKEAMPKEFVDSFYSKGPGQKGGKPKGQPATPPPTETEEEPALFGPKK